MAHQAPLKYIFYIAATPEKVWEGFVSRESNPGCPTRCPCVWSPPPLSGLRVRNNFGLPVIWRRGYSAAE